MRKHLSVLALYARNTFIRVLAVTAAAGVLESALFFLHWSRRDLETPVTAEELLAGIPQIWAFAFLLLAVLLFRSDGEGQSVVSYTLQRLRIHEETTVLWKTAYNSICILLFWAVQTAVMLGLLRWYASAIRPEYSSSQTVFLAFYRVPFLHNLLPLDNWTRYVRNIVLFLAMSFSTALRNYKLRRGSQYGWGMIIFLWGVMAASFRFEISSWIVDAAMIVVPLIALIAEAEYLLKEWRSERGEQNETQTN